MSTGVRLAAQLMPSDERGAFVMLGQMIRRLRTSRGITQSQLGRNVNLTQSRISKIESGTLHTGLPHVRRVAVALEATRQELRELEFQFRLTKQPPTSYQVIVTRGVEKKQAEIRRYEEASKTIDQYEPTIIPGLLQIPNYIRDIMREFMVPSGDIELGVKARQLRQRIVIHADRHFHFILSETALHTVPRSRQTQIEQLKALLIHTARRNTTIGIIPAVNGTVPLAMTGFILFDSAFATAETTVSEQHITEPTDVKILVSLHRRLAAKAVYGDDARALIRRAIDHFHSTLS
ncbi:MAG: helix-turn-helix domain-containing protein [Rhodoglobus sp.]